MTDERQQKAEFAHEFHALDVGSQVIFKSIIELCGLLIKNAQPKEIVTVQTQAHGGTQEV